MTTNQGAQTADLMIDSRAPWFRVFQGVLLVIVLVTATTFAILLQQFLAEEAEHTVEVREAANVTTQRAARQIQAHLTQIMPAVQDFAWDLSEGRLHSATLIPRFERVLDKFPQLFGVGAAYEPTGGVKPFAPFMVRRENRPPFLVQLEQSIDYTAFKEQWYQEPLLDGAQWSEPYVGKGQTRPVVDYAVPFHRPGDDPATAAPAGIVYAAVALDKVERMLAELGSSITGYQYIISKEGRFITHPRKELVRAGKSIFELAWETGDTALFSASIRAVKGERNTLLHSDPVTGEDAYIIYEPIPELGWSIVTVALMEHDADANEHRRSLMHIVTVGGMAGLSLTLFLLGLTQWRSGREWIYVGIMTLFFMLTTLVIWKIEHDFPAGEVAHSEEIVNQSSLRRFIEGYAEESQRLKADKPIFVPTGVFIQSIEFTNSNNVKLTGYIWQKYKRGVHDEISRGFVLPEAESVVVKEVYNRLLSDDADAEGLLSAISLAPKKKDECNKRNSADQNGAPHECSQLIGWYFSTSVRQSFSYAAYPFDDQYVWLRLWHKDFDRNVVLVPDLGSYKVTQPSALPGIETDFVLPGWTLRDSVFAYQRHGYNTNFGIDGYVGQDAFPELYFNVHLKRDFLGPFVLHFLPQFVVGVMLFLILLMGSKEGEKAKWLGFAAKDIVRGSSVLIVVLIFAHASLRRSIDAASLVYLEHFYMVLYVMCLAVSFNSIVFAYGTIRAIEYRDNLLPKLLYWPLMGVLSFAITFLSFY